jgi:hypothetical protein
VLVAMLVMAILKGSALDPKSAMFLSIFAALMVGLMAHAAWRLRAVAPDARMRGYGPAPEVVQAHAQRGSRQMPLASLAIGLVGTVGSYFYMAWQHRGYPVIVILAPALLLLGLAGTIHPPIFYAMRRDLGEQPEGARMIAYFLTAIGLAVGGFLAWVVFWR